SQRFLQGRLDLTDDQYTALGRLVEKGFQQFGFLRSGEILPVAPASCRFRFTAYPMSSQKRVA
ncbi:MAG: hypothetical protein WBB96_01665, partial [Candidatus Dechloromonas phosphoritropha]